MEDMWVSVGALLLPMPASLAFGRLTTSDENCIGVRSIRDNDRREGYGHFPSVCARDGDHNESDIYNRYLDEGLTISYSKIGCTHHESNRDGSSKYISHKKYSNYNFNGYPI